MKYLGVLLLLVICLGLVSCDDHYQWEKKHNSVPMESRFWNKASKEYVLNRCLHAPNAVACAVHLGVMCDIYSIYDEEEAKRQVDKDGMSIFDHEHKHCDGWIHQ